MKQEEIEVFDINSSQEHSKKTKKIKNNIDYSDTKITLVRVIVFVVGILLVVTTVFVVLKYTKYFNPIKNMIKKPIVIIEPKVILKEITYDLGAKINKDVNYYIEIMPKDTEAIIDLTKVPVSAEDQTTQVGKFSYTITSKGKQYSGNIIVVDKEPPFVQTKTVYVAAGSLTLEPESFLLTATDNSQKYSAQITNLDEINLNIVKEYTAKIAVSDESGNVTQVEQKMYVLGAEYANLTPLQDTNVSYNDKNDLNWNQVVTERFTTATTKTSAIYTNAVNRINGYNWITLLNQYYPGAKINSDDIMVLYNQYDLIVGLTLRVNLTVQNESKNYYFNY